jgi:hypothetical protein
MVQTRGGDPAPRSSGDGGTRYWMQNPEVPDLTPSTSA